MQTGGREVSVDRDFLRASWPAPTAVVAGTSLRTGGVSGGAYASLNVAAHVGDDPSAVRGNRQRLGQMLDLPVQPQWLSQVHGCRVLELPMGEPEPEGDACWTRRSDVVCLVSTADCLPVLLCSRDASVVAAAHAGWRGLCDGILERTVDALALPPEELMAWLGPAISQPAFEVGGEVRDRFIAEDPLSERHFTANLRGRWQADLYGLARLRLGGAGVMDVYGGGYCTYSEPGHFFSYRRDQRCGRMASLIFRSSEARDA